MELEPFSAKSQFPAMKNGGAPLLAPARWHREGIAILDRQTCSVSGQLQYGATPEALIQRQPQNEAPASWIPASS